MLWNVDERGRYARLRRFARLLSAASMMLGLASCASITEPVHDHALLVGLVIDHSGTPIPGAVVRVGAQSATSGHDGTFSIPRIGSLSFDLVAEHERHLSYSTTVERSTSAEIVVIRLLSVRDVVSAIDRALVEDDLRGAAQWLERARAGNLHDPRLRFLRAVVAYRQDDYARATEELDSFREPVPDAVRLLQARIESES